jgi:hypothetical protein
MTEEHKYVVSLLFGWKFSFFYSKLDIKKCPKIGIFAKVSKQQN